ncbi:hypothetical protein [Puia dinghuensis]|uniref:Uncharacterized protein n=1 Tax=Puia dinghuensis TaxID=1792502 RepID=A0A8J2XS85_9BACT|nr:hypothetical protein [Puia dinghuensis]GGA92864.1 hypothetical protein GCM10011511_15330 [Puia dinghuensis]
MAIVQLLHGHTDLETAYVINNHPYGEYETEKYFWVETNKKRGDRCCSVTLNPRTGRLNNINHGAYHTFVYLYINEEDLVKHGDFDFGLDPAKNQNLFKKMIELYDPAFLSKAQEANIRRKISESLLYDAVYQVQKMEEPAKDGYKKWAFATATKIETVPFDQIADYPAYGPLLESMPLLPTVKAA